MDDAPSKMETGDEPVCYRIWGQIWCVGIETADTQNFLQGQFWFPISMEFLEFNGIKSDLTKVPLI